MQYIVATENILNMLHYLLYKWQSTLNRIPLHFLFFEDGGWGCSASYLFKYCSLCQMSLQCLTLPNKLDSSCSNFLICKLRKGFVFEKKRRWRWFSPHSPTPDATSPFYVYIIYQMYRGFVNTICAWFIKWYKFTTNLSVVYNIYVIKTGEGIHVQGMHPMHDSSPLHHVDLGYLVLSPF